jgi:hydrogenase maturation protease
MTLPSDGDRPPVLIVGVGSELRSDDAAGRRVAERILGQHPAGGAEVRVVHQLTPELADTMTGRRLVVVIDASVEVTEVTMTEVVTDQLDGDQLEGAGGGEGAASVGPMSHHLDLAALVGFSRLLGERPGRVLAIAVPAFDLTLGTGLSSGTAEAVSEAVVRTLACCQDVFDPARTPRM